MEAKVGERLYAELWFLLGKHVSPDHGGRVFGSPSHGTGTIGLGATKRECMVENRQGKT